MKELLKRIFWKRISGKNNVIEIGKPAIRKNFQLCVHGNNNTVIIGEGCKLINTQLTVLGDNCTVNIDREVRFYVPCTIHMESGSTLEITRLTGIRGVDFNLRGAGCKIGYKCMFSYGINVRNHDAHPVIDVATGKANNLPKNVVFGDHVWVAQNSSILKGCNIGSESIVAYGAVVTKGCDPGCILAGNPAKVVRKGITWDFNFEKYL